MSSASDFDLVAGWIRDDPIRWELLGLVRSLGLPYGCIAAGFVRNAVWARLHGLPSSMSDDVDVIWFDTRIGSEGYDREIEDRLRMSAPEVNWSVKNQARMHTRNGDQPYTSVEDAMRHWPETATAVAVRRTIDDRCEVVAPFGLDDLLSLRLRPAGSFAERKRSVFEDRVQSKGWLDLFSKLRLVD